MNFKPFFSIIVPIYNTESFLAQCLLSILKQTHSNFEALLVDDGSPDGGAGGIFQKIVGNDNRFQFFRTENQGVSEARNFAMQKATGEFLLFVDSDDYIKEDYLEKVYNYLIKDEQNWNSVIYYNSSFTIVNSKETAEKNFDTKNFKKEIIHFTLPACGIILNKNVVGNNKFPDFRPEDQAFYLKIGFDYLHKNKQEILFKKIDNSGYVYNQHTNSYSSNATPGYHEKNMIQVYKYLQRVCKIPMYYKLIIHFSLNRILQYDKTGLLPIIKRKIYSLLAKILSGWYFK